MGQTSEFQLTEDDFQSANYLRLGWRRTWIAIGVVSLLAAANYLRNLRGIESQFVGGRHEFVVFAILAPFAIVLVAAPVLLLLSFLLRKVLVPWQSRRFYSRQKSLRRPRRVSWDDERLTTEGADFVVPTPWSDFRKWREDAKIFALYVTDQKFQIIPKRAFAKADDLAEFGSLVRAKIAPKAGARRRAG
jgi:hypothetical protein